GLKWLLTRMQTVPPISPSSTLKILIGMERNSYLRSPHIPINHIKCRRNLPILNRHQKILHPRRRLLTVVKRNRNIKTIPSLHPTVGVSTAFILLSAPSDKRLAKHISNGWNQTLHMFLP